MPPQFVFEMRDVSKTFGEKVVLRDINLSFFYGAKIGVVGENGAGKSTLLRIMAGLDKDFDGTASLAKGMRVRYVAQEPQLDLDKTVRENLLTAMKPDPGPGRPLQRDHRPHGRPEAGRRPRQAHGRDGPAPGADRRLRRLGTGPHDGHRLRRPGASARRRARSRQLSGGERRRVALGMALLEKPDLLLLDEPTNHLDAETIQWLEQTLREYPGTVIIVTHDRYFLDNITKWILELEDGRGLPFEGNYSSWLDQKAQLLRIIEKRETQRQKTLERELEWIRKSHQGRLQKNEARVKAYEQLAGQQIDPVGETIIQIAPGPRLGEKVLQFQNVCKGFRSDGDVLNLIQDCSFNVPRGAMVGVIGPNGTGKTTLLRMIVGQEQPDAGTIELGPSVVLSYVDQHRDALDDENTRVRPRSPAAPTASSWATSRSTPAPTWPASISAVRSSRRRWANVPAASETASTWPKCSAAAATCCCWTSRPTTSTWPRCGCWSRR